MEEFQTSHPEITPSPQSTRSQDFMPKQSFYQRHRRQIWGALIAVALAVAALIVYILFFYNRSDGPEFSGDMEIILNVPEETVSGSEISYEINYQNTSNSLLANVAAEVFYPSDFEFTDATPDPGSSEGRLFSIPDLVPQKKGKIVIVGTLSGSVQELKSFTVKFRYEPQNFRSVFVTEKTASTVVLAPDIDMEINAPDQIVAGQTLAFDINIKNISQREFENLELVLSYPGGFIKDSASPASTEGDNVWKLDSLLPDGEQTIRIRGKQSGDAGVEAFIQAELFQIRGRERNSAGRSFAFVQISPSPLVLAHSVTGRNQEFFPGEKVSYSVDFENRSSTPLQNTVISLVFETGIFDLSGFSSKSGQLQSGAIVWTPAAVPELLVIDPGERGSFEVTVPIRSQIASLPENPVGRTRTEFRSAELPEAALGDTLEFQVPAEIQMGTGAALISGPNPPRAGQTTVYRVTIEIKNTVNDVNSAKFSAIIPRVDTELDISTLAPAAEAVNARFVPASGLLEWDLGRIFAFSGSIHDSRSLTFDLKVAPEIDVQRFSGVQLLANLQIQGIDDFTGLPVSASQDKVDTR